MLKHRTIDSAAFILLLLAVAAVYALMSWLTPPQLDDLLFMAVYRSHAGGSPEFSPAALAGYIGELRMYDNSRLANFLSPFSTLFTPWRELFPLLTGAAMALTLLLGLKICRLGESHAGNRHCFGYAVLLLALMTLLLPWRNCLFVADYALNYLYASAINLLFLWVMTLKWRLLRRPWTFAGALLLAAVAGAWHEGFSMTVIAGLALMWLLPRTRPVSWRWVVVMAVYALATAWILFCPGIMSRAGREVGERFAHLNWKAFIDLGPVLLLFGTTFLLCLFRRGRRCIAAALSDGSFVALATASLAGAALSVVVEHTPRTGFWPSLCAILALLIMLRSPLAALTRPRWAMPLALLVVGLWAAQSVLAIRSQRLFYDESHRIMALFESTDSSTVYYDILSPDSVSIATLYFPVRTSWVTGFHYQCLAEYLARPEAVVVPTALRHIPAAVDTLSSPGAAHPVMRSGGALFTRTIHDLDYLSPCLVELTLRGQDAPVRTNGLAHLFVTAAGDSLTYIRPYKVNPAEAVAVELVDYEKRGLPNQ